MKAILILAVLTVSVNSQAINEQLCGTRPLSANKIVGGTTTIPGDHAWTVVMLWFNSFRCGGSLINSRWILTAAHCAASLVNPSGHTFVIGAHNRLTGESWTRRIYANLIIRHPAYNSVNFKNDVTLYRLSEAVEYRSEILPICIPTNPENYPGRVAVATGWGTTSEGDLATFKQQVELVVQTDAACSAFYGTAYDPATMICAGVVGDGKDICKTDSGSPLVIQHSDRKWYEIGIASFGKECGDISIYARTSVYASWIQQQINANS